MTAEDRPEPAIAAEQKTMLEQMWGTPMIGTWGLPRDAHDPPDDREMRQIREGAIHSAAYVYECGSGQFPADEAEKIIAMAERLTRYIVDGQ